MVDSSWDHELPAPSRKRGSAWGKILAGCGIAAAAAIVLAVVGAMGFVNRKMNDPEVRKEMGHALWPLIRALVDELGTDEGARSVYARHRDLRGQFPTEEAFLDSVRSWRPSLAGLPAQPPGPDGFDSSLSFQGLRFTIRLADWKTLALLVQGRGRHRDLPLKRLEVR